MKKIFLALPLAVLLFSGCGSSPKNSPSATNPPVDTSSGLKFSDQPYYSSSYLISSETLSPEAQKALAGFELSKQPQTDGLVLITLKATQPQYHDQQYILKPGQQLYFIDKFMADDAGGNELNIADDTAVVVDSFGNVVQPPDGF